MSSTNKTTNYGLPIFLGTDVPSWLTDWNNAMQVIDEAIGNALNAGETADADVKILESSLTVLTNSFNELVPIVEEHGTLIGALTPVVEAINSALEQVKLKIGEMDTTVGKVYSGTLSAGETTLTIAVDELTKNSLIDVYTDVFGVSPSKIECDVTQKVVVLTFDARSSLLNVRVKVGV